MRSILTFTIAAVIAASAIAPASAVTRHKRTPAPVQSEESVGGSWQQSPVAARPGAPSTVYQRQPGVCFTDEGYGRYASCDQAGN